MSKKCYRCGKKANQSWNICADGNKIKYICDKCDIELNEMVLKFMGFRNWKSKMKKYKDTISVDILCTGYELIDNDGRQNENKKS